MGFSSRSYVVHTLLEEQFGNSIDSEEFARLDSFESVLEYPTTKRNAEQPRVGSPARRMSSSIAGNAVPQA